MSCITKKQIEAEKSLGILFICGTERDLVFNSIVETSQSLENNRAKQTVCFED